LNFLKGVLANAPIWIWPLFILLLVIGLMATRDRRSPVAPFYALPFLGILALGATRELGSPQLAGICFGGGAILCGLITYRVQGSWIVARDRRFIHLRGEWLTLITLMVIFFSRFLVGMLEAVNPALLNLPVMVAALAFVFGAASGSFLGRSVRILRTRVDPHHPAAAA